MVENTTKVKKPSRKELILTIERLLRLLTSTMTKEEVEEGECSIHDSRNPYCRPSVKAAMKTLARDRGIDEKKYLDVNIHKGTTGPFYD